MRTNPRLIAAYVLMILVMVLIGWQMQQGILPQAALISIMHLASLPFMVMAIVEINGSEFIDKKQKTMWTFGFLIMPLVTGLLYLASERRKLLSN